MKQNSQRWTVLRLNNLYHSTLSVNNQLQQVTGSAKIDKSSDATKFCYAVLTRNGKKLHLKAEGPATLQMKTWPTTPVQSYDAENPGTILVGFECTIPANTTEFFQVSLIPGKFAASIPLSKPLKDW